MASGNDTIGGTDTLGGWPENDPVPEPRRDADTLGGGETLGADGRIVLAGRYEVVKRLGEGGMGSVWLAEDRKLDNRKVAIKMLPAVLAGRKTAFKQVKAEALMAMRLAHPNIATVRGFEEDESGNPFLVMDYIEGQGVDDILSEKETLSEEETVRLLSPVAAALDYAHAKGVVHRDVKPGNVMVDRNGTPFVLDFGIAREIQETMTRVTGKLSSGTLPYMSPEQLHGRAPKPAQDVYSFAAMAYECLTGHPPFSRGQVEWQIDHDAPEDLPESVSEPLRRSVMAGLAKGPEDRPASCAGVLGATGFPGMAQTAGRAVPGEPGRQAGGLPQDAERRDSGSAGTPRPTSGGGGMGGEVAGDGDVFLQKVRLGKELDAAGTKATPEEREGLGKIRELFAAGEEALKTGDKKIAEGLFRQTEERLEAWSGELAAREERERREEETRRQREREENEARENARRIAEAKRREEEIRHAREREEKRRMLWKRGGKVALTAVVAGLAWWGISKGIRAYEKAQIPRITAKLRAGDVHQPGETKTVTLPGGAKMELAWCPPGAFLMGSPSNEDGRENDEKQHRVTLTQGFWLVKTEVTQGQWKEVMGYNRAEFQNGDNYPVENVSWGDCQEFVEKLNSRYPQAGMRWALPTEAQWEYACRADSSTAYFWGNALNGDKANCDGNHPYGTTTKGPYKQKTTPVGSYEANAWGLYDMHGNVWEWCSDWDGNYPTGAVTDPTGPSSGSGRVARGGSWISGARNCRSADRVRGDPGRRYSYLGLRVALLPVQ